MEKKNIVTVSREYGTGGYEIGQRVAEAMKYDFYDKALITDLAEKIMVSETFIANTENQQVRRNVFKELMPIFAYGDGAQQEYIFNEQGKFIVSLAEKGNCVFAGRRADYYLRNNPHALHLFFYAEMDFKVNRICELENCTSDEAVVKIRNMDKHRRTSYEYTTGRKWGDIHNYDRLICTSSLGIDKCVEEIVALLK